jgi:hypothetical protein
VNRHIYFVLGLTLLSTGGAGCSGPAPAATSTGAALGAADATGASFEATAPLDAVAADEVATAEGRDRLATRPDAFEGVGRTALEACPQGPPAPWASGWGEGARFEGGVGFATVMVKLFRGQVVDEVPLEQGMTVRVDLGAMRIATDFGRVNNPHAAPVGSDGTFTLADEARGVILAGALLPDRRLKVTGYERRDRDGLLEIRESPVGDVPAVTLGERP